MDQYVSNSDKSRNKVDSVPEKRVEPVVSGQAVAQKKTGFGKFKEGIVAEDFRSVGSWLFTEVIVKSTQRFIYDMVTNGITMLLYGQSSAPKSSGTGINKIQYNSIYPGYKSSSEPSRPNSPTVFDYDNIIFSNRGDAEAVLSTMRELLDQFQVVSVADLYEMANVENPPYTANNYGWTNLRNADVMRCKDGYILKLPKATNI